MNGNDEIKNNDNNKAVDEPTRKEQAKENLEENAAPGEGDLRKAVLEAKAKAEENWDLFLRARAEMDNTRRRAQMDVENAQKYGIERFARELLAIVDSLEKGLETAMQHAEEATAWHTGMELTLKLFLDTLEKFGIHCINPLGQPFDPAAHEVLAAQPSNEIEPNKVLLVVQKGFSLHDRLLRPARVIVASALPTPQEVNTEVP